MIQILIRGFPHDFIPDFEVMRCLFGDTKRYSGRGLGEDTPFSKLVPDRPAGLPRYKLISIFWGKQLRGWFALCKLRRYERAAKPKKTASGEKKTKNKMNSDDDSSSSSSSSSDEDDDDDDDKDDDDDTDHPREPLPPFPELWISNTKLEVERLPRGVDLSGSVNVSRAARTVVFPAQKKEGEVEQPPSFGAKKGGGFGKNSAAAAAPRGKKQQQQRRQRDEDGGGFGAKRKKVSFNEEQDQQQQGGSSGGGADEDKQPPTSGRDENSAVVSQDQEQQQQQQQPTKLAPQEGRCRFCGGTDHISRKCSQKNKGGGAVKNSASSGGGGAAATGAEVETEKPVASSVMAPKEEQKTAKTFNAAAAASDDAASKQTPSPKIAPSPKPQQIARDSKDQCKFCGSTAHLSRKCPNKGK